MYNSVAEMFEAVFGKKATVCKPRRLSNSQLKKNKELQKTVIEFVKELEAAYEATKNSRLRFD